MHDHSTHKRFASKVGVTDERGCWPWIGARVKNGYGHFLFEGRVQKAHRAAWIMKNGPIPDGLSVLHHCDNPRCVNPAHLFLGTDADNAADRDTKGRGRGRLFNLPGELSRTAKLTREQVEYVRQSTEGGSALARKFGVSHTAISFIRCGRSWRTEK